MDANNPNTQKRSTQEYRGISGRNLAFGGRKIPNSGNLGTAWLEIRRATAIEVNEVSTVNKKLTLTWVASDHPDTGVPYATFIINFVLDESAMNAVMNSTSLSSPSISSITRASIRRSSTEEGVESGIQNLDSSNGDIVESKITPSVSAVNSPHKAIESGISETAVQDSDSDVVQILSGTGAQKRSRSDSQTENSPDVKRSRVDEAVAPTTPPTLNPQIPEITTPKTPVNHNQLPEIPVDAFTIPKMGLCKIPKIVIPSVQGVFLVGASIEDEIPDVPPPPILDTPKSEEPAPKTPTQTQTPLPTPEVLVPKTPSQTQTVPETPVKNTQIQETELDLSDDEGDDFESKLAIIEMEIEACTRKVAKLTEKEKYMKIKCQRAQSVSEIKSLEALCGPIPSKTPTQYNWDLIQNNMSDDDDDEKGYSEKKIHMEEILPSLESYRSALQYKKIYLEKKTVLGRLRKNAHNIEQRVGELSANFTDILSMTPPAN